VTFERSSSRAVERSLSSSVLSLLLVLRLVRMALLIVLFLLVLGLIVAAGSPETGPTEKAVLIVGIVGLLAAGIPVHRIGARP
jgi:hypothetical protein